MEKVLLPRGQTSCLKERQFMFHVLFLFCLSCLYVNFRERAELLALLCVMFTCVLALSHMVAWVRCGT